MKHQNKILKDFKRLHRLYDDGAVFCAFDTETTAISPSTGRIIEIGCIKFSKYGVLNKWEHLFYPQLQIPPFITELTHISNQMVKNQPLINELLPEFLELIENSILIGHNIQFDLNFLNSECLKTGYKPVRNKAIDTLQFSQFLYPDLEKHKLDFLADYFKINKGSSHRAFDDAQTCYQLFLQMIEDSKKHD